MFKNYKSKFDYIEQKMGRGSEKEGLWILKKKERKFHLMLLVF